MNWLRNLIKTNSVISTVTASVLVVVGFALPPTATQAQLEEIIVTAQRREENLQDVSLSVTAITGQKLDDFGIENWDDIELPAVHIGSGMRNEALYIRGIGSAANTGFDQSVPIYSDGAAFTRGRAENMAFLDVDRIEVLRGPQPIYFGKNAIGGALSLNSRRPTDEFEGTLQVTNEFEHSEFSVFAALSGPLSDSFKVRAAFKTRDMDGWLNNSLSGNSKEPNIEDRLGRLSAVWQPSDSVEIYAKLEEASTKDVGHTNQLYGCPAGSLAAQGIDPKVETCQFDRTRAAVIVPGRHPEQSWTSGLPYIETFDLESGQLAVNWMAGDYELSATVSSYDYDSRLPQFDIDGSPAPLGTANIFETYEQQSTEFRVVSPQGGRVDWIFGLYSDSGDLKDAGIVGAVANILPIPGARVSPNVLAQQSMDSSAVFGEIGVQMTETLKAKVGFRHDEVEKSIDHKASIFIILPNPALMGIPAPGPLALPGAAINPGFAPWAMKESRKDTASQPSLTLEWTPDDNRMYYFSWKEGFKSGGYDLDAFFYPTVKKTLGFNPEEVEALELGARMDMESARVNVTAFSSDYKDLQVAVFNGVIGFNTSNAGKAKSQGVELETIWSPADNFSLNGSLTWLDATYRDFPGAQCYKNQPATTCKVIATVPQPTSAQDLSGQSLPFAPKWSGTFGAERRRLLGNGLELVSRLDVFFTEDFYADGDADPNVVQSGYTKIDLRIALSDQDGNWEVAFVGRNLTDELTAHYRGDAVGFPAAYTAMTDRTRQYGFQARFNF